MSKRKHPLSVALGLLLGVSASAWAGGVPAGFEDLVQSHPEILSTSLLGKPLGDYPFQVDDAHVVLADAAPLLAALPLRQDLDAQQLAALRAALAAPLPRNSQLACDPRLSPACGYLPDPDPVGVIYDEARQTLALFVRPDWLARAQWHPADGWFTPSADARNALVHSQQIDVSGGRGYRSVAVDGRAALGVGAADYLGVDWRYLSNHGGGDASQRLSLDQAFYRHDLGRRHYLQAGRMDAADLTGALGGSYGFQMLPQGLLDGVRVGTTQAYRNDDPAARRRPLEVILPRPARVDAYRGQQLLGSAYLGAGIVQFGTVGFPAGSYPVTLCIYEDGRLARSQTVPYSTGASAGQARSWEWFAQAGRVRRDGFGGDGVGDGRGVAAEAAIKYNLDETLSAALGMARQDGRVYGEARLDWAHAFTRSQVSADLSAYAGSHGARGDSALLSWYGQGIGVNLSHYRLDAPDCGRGAGSCYASQSATFSAAWGKVSYALGYRQSRSAYWQAPAGFWPAAGAGWTLGAAPSPLPGQDWDVPAWTRERSLLRSLSLSANRSWRIGPVDLLANASVYRARESGGVDRGGYLTVTASRYRNDSTNQRSVLDRANLRWERGGNAARGAGYDYSQTRTWDAGDYRQLEVHLAGGGGAQSAGVSGIVDGRWGDVAATVNDYYSAGEHTPAFSGSYASTLAIGRQGVFVGRDPLRSSLPAAVGFTLDAPADPGDADDRAQVDLSAMQGRQRLRQGQHLLLRADSYRTFRTHIGEPEAVTSQTMQLGGGTGDFDWFLLPGKLAVHTLDARVLHTYLGTLQVHGEHLLDGGYVLNGEVPPIGDGGLFMGELDRVPDALYVIKQGELYRCPVRVQDLHAMVRNIGVVQCEASSKRAVPASLLREPRAQRVLQLMPIARAD
ncbi:TcfC E-set like domain-containing protein [Xanthomonas theicola]|uniref:TcfC E-set like domain-containing protein n=1 Tax=Xanthomonas theicola TaxID=56464 RepID=UPI00361566AA